MKTYKYLTSFFGDIYSVTITEGERKKATMAGKNCVLTMGKVLKEPAEDSTGSGWVYCECEDGRVLSGICMIAKLRKQ